MILECQACGTKYRFDASLIRPQGTKVRCSRCGFTWTLYPEEVVPGEEVRRAPKRGRWALVLVLVALLALLGYTYRDEVRKGVQPLWEVLEESLPIGKPRLELLRLVGYRLQVEGQEVFAIEGRVVSRAKEVLGEVRLEGRLLDGQGRVVARAEGVAGKYLPYDRIREMTLDELRDFIASRAETEVIPGTPYPFTILFLEPPEAVEEFQVEVAGYRALRRQGASTNGTKVLSFTSRSPLSVSLR